ncbi:CalY family protein [Nocardioides sp. TF02-7]|uniref:CalY family protein n=1 Tax=Nocardioides sp. TF02-7 TaxID=2917724 RepID=UPI001F0539B3|nr:CalY family protein [Nocardioides sp. TF02-7]UMG94289.1 CalY family protein [Nocardioides sp. TF02-7]
MKSSKKILVPLATLAAAGAIAVGSGATFSSETGNTISAVTAGSLEHTNSKDGQAIFTLKDMKPGDTVTGSLTLTNTGSLPAAFALVEKESTNTFTGSNLTLTITDTASGTDVYDGTFGGLVDGARTELGEWAPEEAHTYEFTVRLDEATTNVDQRKTAGATYTWTSVQLDGEDFPK